MFKSFTLYLSLNRDHQNRRAIPNRRRKENADATPPLPHNDLILCTRPNRRAWKYFCGTEVRNESGHDDANAMRMAVRKKKGHARTDVATEGGCVRFTSVQ